MKKYTALFVVVCLLCTTVYSQGWKTVRLNDTGYFSGDANNVNVIWIASASGSPDSQFHFYKSIRTSTYNGCIDSMADTWLGNRFFRNNSGDEYYFNDFGDSILIKTHAGIGATWTLTKEHGANRIFQATVTQMSTQIIDGVVDSVKKISIQAMINGLPVADWYNNKEFILSKDHGWIKTLDLFRFPSKLNPPYFFGATVDSAEQYRLDRRLRSINLRDTTPVSRFAPGNEWILVRKYAYHTFFNPPLATTIQHDSVLSLQVNADGSADATLKTREISFSSLFRDTVFQQIVHIAPVAKISLTDTILPSYNWSLQNVSSNYFFTRNGETYMRQYKIDTVCNTLLEFGSDRVKNNSTGIAHDTNANCIVPNSGLVYAAIINWRYLEGFGYIYYDYFFASGDPTYSYDKRQYPYIKIANCILGSKSVLSANDFAPPPQVSISPNPATNFVFVNLPSAAQSATIEILDASGRRLRIGKANNLPYIIDLTEFSSGVYFIRIFHRTSTVTEKFVIMK